MKELNFILAKPAALFSLMLLFIFSSLFAFSQPTGFTRLKMLNFSPYTVSGQNPDLGSQVPESQIISLLDSIKPYTEGIRTYGVNNGLEKIPALAKARNLKVYMGIWLGNQATVNSTFVETGINLAKSGYADKIIVGNETLLNNYLTTQQITGYLDQVKTACPGIPVSYSDIPSKLIENPTVIDHCDFVSVNVYPFWEGVSIDCAIKSFHQSMLKIIALAKGKPVFISETGWKTEGMTQGEAVPSMINASRYLKEVLNWSKATGIEVALFSAFDEPWKSGKNDNGWGIFTSNAVLKKGLENIFIPITSIDTTWLCSKLVNSGKDTILIDMVPLIGNTSDNLKGRVNFVNPCDHQIAAYIKVGNGWWTKPTFTQPAVTISCDGKWSLDFTTGGSDSQATLLHVFLIPSGYQPPPCNGAAGLPADIFKNAISSKLIDRTTSMKKLEVKGGIKYFPNPVTNGIVNFQLLNDIRDENAFLLIVQTDGKVLKKWPLSQLHQSVSVKDLPSGIYHLILKTGKGDSLSAGKLVIAH